MNGSMRLFQLQNLWMIGILFFTTKHGISKRSPISSFCNIRNNGLIALNLREDDEFISVRLTDGIKNIIIGTKDGLLIRFQKQMFVLWVEQRLGLKEFLLVKMMK